MPFNLGNFEGSALDKKTDNEVNKNNADVNSSFDNGFLNRIFEKAGLETENKDSVDKQNVNDSKDTSFLNKIFEKAGLESKESGNSEIKDAKDNKTGDNKDNSFLNRIFEKNGLVDSDVLNKDVSNKDSVENQNTNEINKQENESEIFGIYYDDDGNVYRMGDSLLPNNVIHINGYTFETDSLGRVFCAYGQLKIKEDEYKRNMDSMQSVGKGFQLDTDQRGHLIGHQFEGSGGIENLIPMDGKLNQGDYKKLELMLASAVKDGSTVYLKVEPIFKDDSYRPDKFAVTYDIDGEKEIVIFNNKSEELI